MKKFTVLFFTLLAFIVSNSMALAQDNATKKRPAPIPRTHIVEDYLPILGKQARANGIRPPKPFFISAIYYHMEIPQTITNAVGYDFQSATHKQLQMQSDMIFNQLHLYL